MSAILEKFDLREDKGSFTLLAGLADRYDADNAFEPEEPTSILSNPNDIFKLILPFMIDQNEWAAAGAFTKDELEARLDTIQPLLDVVRYIFSQHKNQGHFLACVKYSVFSFQTIISTTCKHFSKTFNLARKLFGT